MLPAPFDPAAPIPLEALAAAAAWPFEEARKLVARVERTGQRKVLFETGYGPSGLPHIGTFGEVARTMMVRHAFTVLTAQSIETHLIVFSDDMDGLRKVPDNVPDRAGMATYLGKPLTQIPDPFGKFESFAHHNNAMLRTFLDRFGFAYEFISSTALYRSGRFDQALLRILERLDRVQAIMLPSLREERAATYSPFLPIHPRTGIVMQVPIDSIDVGTGRIAWRDPATGELFETPVTGGQCKLQWKPDWAMRWFALGVDYEMAGKDLIDSVKLSGEIVRALGGQAPEGFNYELFLDQNGQKISKSKGNGLTIDEWLTYASPQSLSFFMYQKPTAAKRLYFDVIPRAVDDYLAALDAYPRQGWKERLGNPVWHIHAGEPPAAEVLVHPGEQSGVTSVTFAMLLNLAAVANSEEPRVLWGFLRRYAPSATPDNHPALDRMIHYAVRYFRDFVRPAKSYRTADPIEREALKQLSQALAALPADASAATIQTALYDVARTIPRYQDLTAKTAVPGRPGVSNAWFNTLYQILLGEERGPRFGSFIALYGIEATRRLIDQALSGDLAEEHRIFVETRARA
jgi:lysyl-tRNA synthetase class 1